MTHKAQTSIIDFVSLLGSQCILSSILCQGRTPTSRNEFFVRSRARNCSINIKTPSPESTLNLEVVREDNSVEGPFLTLDFKSSLLRASRWNNFRVFSVRDKLLVFLEGGLLNERKTHSEETQLVIQQRQNWKKIKHDLVLYVFHSIYYRFGPNAPEINLLFSLPKVLDAPNKGACGVNPTSVDFSHTPSLRLWTRGSCKRQWEETANFMWPRCSQGCQPLLRWLAATKIVWIQVLLKQPQRLKALCGALWRWGQKYDVMNETPIVAAQSMRYRPRRKRTQGMTTFRTLQRLQGTEVYAVS